MSLPPHVVLAHTLVNRVPFQHQGRTLDGMDCAGEIVWLGAQEGRQFQDLTGYGPEPLDDKLRQMLRINLGPPVQRPMQIGDVVLIRFRRRPHHVALVADHPEGLGLIHAYAANQWVVWHGIDAKWRFRILEVYAWPA